MTASIAAVLAYADGWDGHMGWGGAWWMVIFGTVMIAGFVVLVVWLVRAAGIGVGGQGLSEDPLASARRILAERFARGDLTMEEYSERVEHLQ